MLIPLLLAPLVTFVMVSGDSYPNSRIGVTRRGQDVWVVSAVCPGERLRGVEVGRRRESHTPPDATSSSVPYTDHLAASGDVPMVPAFDLDAFVPGMTHDVVPNRPLRSTDAVSVHVFTSQMEWPYALRFSMSDVPKQGVLGFAGIVYPNDEDFRRSVLADIPCVDAFGRERQDRFLERYWKVSGALVFPAGCLMVWDFRRRRAERVPR